MFHIFDFSTTAKLTNINNNNPYLTVALHGLDVLILLWSSDQRFPSYIVKVDAHHCADWMLTLWVAVMHCCVCFMDSWHQWMYKRWLAILEINSVQAAATAAKKAQKISASARLSHLIACHCSEFASSSSSSREASKHLPSVGQLSHSCDSFGTVPWLLDRHGPIDIGEAMKCFVQKHVDASGHLSFQIIRL